MINIDLNDPRFDSVFRYALDVAPDKPAQDSIRELLLIAVSIDAKDAAIRSARKIAYMDARNRAFTAFAAFLKGLAADLDAWKTNPNVSAGVPQAENAITTDGITVPEAA